MIAMQKLVEAKDQAVRAYLYAQENGLAFVPLVGARPTDTPRST